MADRIHKYEKALNAFERAREMIKYMPQEIATDELSKELDQLIPEAQKVLKETEAKLKSADLLEAQRTKAEGEKKEDGKRK